MRLTHVTMHRNYRLDDGLSGFAVYAAWSQVSVRASVVYDGDSSHETCQGSFGGQEQFISLGYNYLDDDTCVLELAETDIVNDSDPFGADPDDWGGPTPTLLPAWRSDLIDAVPLAEGDVATDQRGLDRGEGEGHDIGAA